LSLAEEGDKLTVCEHVEWGRLNRNEPKIRLCHASGRHIILHRRAIHDDYTVLLPKTWKLLLENPRRRELRTVKRNRFREIEPFGDRGLWIGVN